MAWRRTVTTWELIQEVIPRKSLSLQTLIHTMNQMVGGGLAGTTVLWNVGATQGLSGGSDHKSYIQLPQTMHSLRVGIKFFYLIVQIPLDKLGWEALSAETPHKQVRWVMFPFVYSQPEHGESGKGPPTLSDPQGVVFRSSAILAVLGMAHFWILSTGHGTHWACWMSHELNR